MIRYTNSMLLRIRFLYLIISITRPHLYHAFIVSTTKTTTTTKSPKSSFSTIPSSPKKTTFTKLNNNNNIGSNNEKEEWNNFNPFEKKSIQEQKIKTSVFTSPRKQKMDSIVMDLYRSNHDETLMHDILIQNEEFLLQPFFDVDSFESEIEADDSIYEKGMTMEEKSDKYRDVMLERIDTAKNGEVKIVLRTMMGFILEKASLSSSD